MENNKYSKFGNFLARGGGMATPTPELLATATPEELASYDIQRKTARNKGLGEMLLLMGDAFQGKDISGRAAQRRASRQPKKRETIKGADGYNYYLDTNERVLPGIEASQTNSSTAGRKDYEYFDSLSPTEQQNFLIATGRLSPELAAKFREARSEGGLDLTPGQKKLDTQFATTAESWLSKDSIQVDANIKNLEEKIGIIERGEANVSGPVIGITPEALQPFVGQTQAKAFLGDVRDIVFQSLKEKLGAQFTEKEGDRLVAAAYDPSLPEEINAKRLRRLLAVVKTMKASKDGMVDIWNQTGTLKDYGQPKATFNNIYDALVEEEFASKTTEELTNIYANTKDLDKKTAILRYAEKLAEQGK